MVKNVFGLLRLLSLPLSLPKQNNKNFFPSHLSLAQRLGVEFNKSIQFMLDFPFFSPCLPHIPHHRELLEIFPRQAKCLVFFVSYRLVLPNILQSYFEKFTRILHLRLLSATLLAMPADHYRHQPFQKSLYDVTWQYDHLQAGVFLRLCIDEFVWFVFYVFPFSNEQHDLSLFSCFSRNLYICVFFFQKGLFGDELERSLGMLSPNHKASGFAILQRPCATWFNSKRWRLDRIAGE